ncbi:hypothetical protein J437_LFUL016243 [Ladona fulva]|uniref:Uncharacterized protein n=1 Tax=Ladona fulva TaxID=123851 RepID=A0A8K0KMN3_LADFU|nr:hypothetical protein J437_LFUL016243 [Ladona fulva]
MFPHCRTLTSEESQEDRCDHSDVERSIMGMCTRCGNTSQVYYPATGGDLFTEYINCFLKMKQEESGYPSWCETAEYLPKYISFQERE